MSNFMVSWRNIFCRSLFVVAGWAMIAPGAAAQEIRDLGPTLVTPPDAPVIRAHPLNVHLVVSEEFLNQLVSRREIQTGEVRDQFEDTPIAGQQVTATNLRIDLEPSATEGRILMVLNGDTSSTTSGFSPQAIINSIGKQNFQARKEVLFDGYQFATRHATVSVVAESQNVGAVTMFSGRPLGPLVEQIVLGAAQKRQPAAEAFARQRVVERVYPEFDQQVDAQLASGNVLLKEKLQARLKAAKLMPERLRVRTTDSHFHLAAAMGLPLSVPAIGPAPDSLVAAHDVSLYLHESLMQGIIERLQLNGQKTSNRGLFQLLGQLGLEVDLPESSATMMDVEIEFAEVDPVTIRIGDDETRVTLRATFKPAGQSLLPPFEVTIPYRIERRQQTWSIVAGPVEARSLGEKTSAMLMTELAVKKVIEASLPKVSFPRELPNSVWPSGRVPPAITSIRSGEGWLVIGIDAPSAATSARR